MMRNLMELVSALDRKTDQGSGDPPPRPPRGEGQGPRDGVYWLRDDMFVPITGKANEIVFLSGQVVMLDPQRFGLTEQKIMAALQAVGTGPHSAASEYQTYLNGTDYDMSHVALLWKASRIVYRMMLESGWAWVKYLAPEMIQLAATPHAAKQQLTAAGERFPMVQIDKITVTLMTEFMGASDRFPQLSRNKTLTFTKEQYQGFAGPFGAILDWIGGGEAPESNYLYLTMPEPVHPPAAQQMSVATPKGYRKRWGITFMAQPRAVAQGSVLIRVPVSTFNKMDFYKNCDRGFTPVSRKGTTTMYSDRWFKIDPSDMEIRRDDRWQSI